MMTRTNGIVTWESFSPTAQKAYDNALFCIKYQFPKKDWNNCGLSQTDSDMIWDLAGKAVTNCKS